MGKLPFLYSEFIVIILSYSRRSGFRDFAKSNSTDGTKEFTSDTEPVELQAIRRQNYGGAFQSSESVAAHQSGKKPRSTSQHDYNNRSYPAPCK